MSFNNFENKYKTESQTDLEKRVMSRRYFLKSMSKLAKVASIKAVLNIPGAKLLETALEKTQSSQEKKSLSKRKKIKEEERKEKVKREEDKAGVVEKSKEEKNPEAISIKERSTFKEELSNFSLKKVKLSLALQKDTEAYYLQKYQSDPQAKRDIERAFKKIDKWLPLMEKIFKREKVPSELAFLAVPESQGNKNAHSSRGARGVFQITKKTGLRYGMKINKRIDERLRIDKSALVCARILKDNQRLLKSWDLALLAYNGGFVWSYAQQTSKNEKYSLDGFLKFIEKKVNKLKELLDNEYWVHRIKKEKSLMSVAKKYAVDWTEIEKYNQLKKNRQGNPIIYPGLKIKIPLKNEQVKKKIYKHLTAGYLENLDYLSKVKATIKIAQTKFRDKNRA